MEHLDEHEMLVEYSEMTSFDFNSKEFEEVRKDVLECKKALSGMGKILRTLPGFKPTRSY